MIVGVDGAGKPSERFGKLVAAEFDTANLYKIAANYLPTPQLRSTTHELSGITVAIIHSLACVPPNIPISKDGQYAKDNEVGHAPAVFASGRSTLIGPPMDSVRVSRGGVDVELTAVLATVKCPRLRPRS